MCWFFRRCSCASTCCSVVYWWSARLATSATWCRADEWLRSASSTIYPFTVHHHHHYHHHHYYDHHHEQQQPYHLSISTEQEGAPQPQQEVRLPSGTQRRTWSEQVPVRADDTGASWDAGSEQRYRSMGEGMIWSMDGWMDRCMWRRGWMDGWMKYSWTNNMIDGWMVDGWMDGWGEYYRWMDGWRYNMMDGWMDD